MDKGHIKIKKKKIRELIFNAQKNEITKYFVYSNLARQIQNEKNKKIVQKIANEEKNILNTGKSLPIRI